MIRLLNFSVNAQKLHDNERYFQLSEYYYCIKNLAVDVWSFKTENVRTSA